MRRCSRRNRRATTLLGLGLGLGLGLACLLATYSSHLLATCARITHLLTHRTRPTTCASCWVDPSPNPNPNPHPNPNPNPSQVAECLSHKDIAAVLATARPLPHLSSWQLDGVSKEELKSKARPV